MSDQQDSAPTIVVFRVWRTARDGGGVLALMPTLAVLSGHCVSYEHIGQHGAADYAGCIRRTRPATEIEARSLRRELEGLGYRVDARRRYSPRRGA